MTNIIESVKDALLARIKNPIIGTIFISWSLSNIKIILEFFFSDNSQKLIFLNSFHFDWVSDAFLPLTMSLIYLYVFPLINYLHENLYDLKLDEIRNISKQKYLLRYYEHQTKTNIEKLKSQDVYATKIIENELESWTEKKKDLNTKIFDLSNELKTAKDNILNERRDFEEKQKPLVTELLKLSKEYQKIKDECQALNNKIQSNEEILSKTVIAIENGYKDTDFISKQLPQHLDTLKSLYVKIKFL
jgi:hypothetical protein